jgi:Undecaprenyl-phosphate galactose phosphotransferase WbaP
MKDIESTLTRPEAAEGRCRSRALGMWPVLDGRIRRALVSISLGVGDIVAVLAALWLADALIALSGLQPRDTHSTYSAVPIAILSFFFVGLYAGIGPSPYERLRLRTHAIAGFIVIEGLIGLLDSNPGHLLIVNAGIGLALLLFGYYIEALIRFLLIHADFWGAPTAVVGCGDHSSDLVRLLVRLPELGLRPAGLIETRCDADSRNAERPPHVIGRATDLSSLPPHIEVVICTSRKELVALAAQVSVPSYRLLLVEDMHDLQSIGLRSRTLDPRSRFNRLFKRTIDMLFALPAAVVAGPIVAVLALVIKFMDPGPAFFVHDRLGRNGTLLRTFKLRTMFADAEQRLEAHLNSNPKAREEWQQFFKLKHDPRVLPVIGMLMRKSSLDELPQLWNVIRGDMSLVGPRPFPPYHMDSFDAEFQALRLSVQPGITGLWQVSSRSDGDLQIQKAQDLFYIRNWSIWLDLHILLQTVPAVLTANGAR